MFLNSVILVLQEALEATLLISVLLTISFQQWNKADWLYLGLPGGLVFSILYASQMARISEWFDYVGQEIFNALLQIAITVLISVCVWALCKNRRIKSHKAALMKNHCAPIFTFCAAATVALAITREGSEVLLYLSGFFHQDQYFEWVMVGSLLGFGIGASIGVLLFYGLLNLPGKWRLSASVFLLALIAGNMLSQAALQLTQADWVGATRVLWDSSAWLGEQSITGHLLYALVGYEATPSIFQVLSYVTGVILVIVFGVLGSRFPANGEMKNPGLS